MNYSTNSVNIITCVFVALFQEIEYTKSYFFLEKKIYMIEANLKNIRCIISHR